MRRTQYEIAVGLGLIILLLSVIPAHATDEAIPSSVCGPAVSSTNQADPADVARGETNNDYGTLSLHARAGMTGIETGDIKSGEANVNCEPDLEKGKPIDEDHSTALPPDE